MNKKYYWLSGGILVALILLAGGWYAGGGYVRYFLYEGKVAKSSQFGERHRQLEQAFVRVTRHPQTAQAYLDLGNLQMALGDLSGAQATLRKAVQLDVHIYPVLVQSYTQAGKYQEAEAAANQMIVALPSDSQSYLTLINLYGAHFQEKHTELPALYQRSYDNTHDGLFLLLSASFFEQDRNYAKAVEFYRQWLANAANTGNRALVEAQLQRDQGLVNK